MLSKLRKFIKNNLQLETWRFGNRCCLLGNESWGLAAVWSYTSGKNCGHTL